MAFRLSSFLFASLAAGAAAAGAPSQEGAPLEEVLVTASLRGEAAHAMPVSVTVLDAEVLRLAGVQHFQDVLGLVPNLNWSAGTSRPRYFQLRGIGELEQYEGAPNPSVGFLIDDIDFSGIGMPATLFDVEQIEVLRGPQGTVYGANALAGIINVRTRAPSAEPEFELEATAGDHGTIGAAAVAGGALDAAERGAWRITAQRYESDGFRRNLFTGRDDTNGYDESALRGKLRWDFTDRLRVDLTAMSVDLDNGYDAFAIDNSRVTRSDRPGRDAQRSRALAARLDYTGFDDLSVRSITTWAQSDIDYSFDGDWGNDRDWGAFAPYDFEQRFARDRRTVSQELRVTGRWWLAGAYVLDTREGNEQLDFVSGVLAPAFTSRYDATNTAVYGEIDVPLARRLRASVGARLERRDTRYADSRANAEDPAEDMLGGHASLEYDLGPGRMLYATAARGYKAGGFNVSASAPDDRPTFDAEFVTSLEAGFKAHALDGRLDAQLAAFYMRRSDQQVATSIQLVEGDPNTFLFFRHNAARGENYGLELAGTWRATQRLQLSAALGALETRYIGYVFGDRDLDGREQAHAPQYQLALGLQYRHPRGFLARIDTQSADDFYFDVSHDERAPAYTLVHAKLGYETERWSAVAWARNLFDESYAMRGFFFANEPPDFEDKRYVQQGDPRQLGVTFTWSFR
jgi:iron complex outermembrane recepter protein